MIQRNTPTKTSRRMMSRELRTVSTSLTTITVEISPLMNSLTLSEHLDSTIRLSKSSPLSTTTPLPNKLISPPSSKSSDLVETEIQNPPWTNFSKSLIPMEPEPLALRTSREWQPVWERRSQPQKLIKWSITPIRIVMEESVMKNSLLL